MGCNKKIQQSITFETSHLHMGHNVLHYLKVLYLGMPPDNIIITQVLQVFFHQPTFLELLILAFLITQLCHEHSTKLVGHCYKMKITSDAHF